MNTQLCKRLVLGSANFGNLYGFFKNPEMLKNDKSIYHILDIAIENNIEYIDTSFHYGASQEKISEYLTLYPHEGFSVISKFFQMNWEAEILRTIEVFKKGKNLRSLLWHNLDFSEEKNEKFSLIKKIKSYLPKEISLGASTYGSENALIAAECNEIECLEIEYNLLNPSVWRTILPLIKTGNKKIYLRSTFQKGFLSDQTLQETHSFHKDIKINQKLNILRKQLQSLAQENKKTLHSLALQYSLQTTDAFVIIGVDSKEQLSQNLNSLKNTKISKDTLNQINILTEEFPQSLFDLRSWN